MVRQIRVETNRAGAGLYGYEHGRVSDCVNAQNPAGHSDACPCHLYEAKVAELVRLGGQEEKVRAWLKK